MLWQCWISICSSFVGSLGLWINPGNSHKWLCVNTHIDFRFVCKMDIHAARETDFWVINSFNKHKCFVLYKLLLVHVLNDHFSGRGWAVGPVYLCISVCLNKNFWIIWPSYLGWCSFTLILSRSGLKDRDRGQSSLSQDEKCCFIAFLAVDAHYKAGLADLNRADFNHWFKSWLKSNDFFLSKKSCDLNHSYLFTNSLC